MFIFTLYRIIKFAFQAFWRNFWLSVVTISVIVLAFISINFLIVLNLVTESSVKVVKDNIDVSVYFKTDTPDNIISEAQSKLAALPEVERVSVVTKEQALEEFRKRHKDDLLILESLEELSDNPLNPTMRIKAKNIDDYDSILNFLDNSKYNVYVSDKNFEDHREYIERINTITNNINKFGIGVSFAFTLIALLIVFNTIKLAIYSQREEIAIMKLVGANNIFISAPYIIEGIMYAVFGCIVSALIIFPIMDFVQPYLDSYFSGNALNLHRYFIENGLMIFGLEFLGLALLNILASGIAVRRYLKI